MNSTINHYHPGSFTISFNREMRGIKVDEPNELFHNARCFSADLIALWIFYLQLPWQQEEG